jgi:predicted Rossmann fold flavoprotein
VAGEGTPGARTGETHASAPTDAGGASRGRQVRPPVDAAAASGGPVVVVGAGAAGFLAAIFARRAGRAVDLLEATDNPGQKILISGGGRCNVLPSRFEPERFISASPRICRAILRSWRLEEVRRFFQRDLGIPLVEEAETGKLFPASNRARDVRDALMSEARRVGVRIRLRARVREVSGDARHVVLDTGETIAAGRLVLATGGASIPKTGSDGAGIDIARDLGHRIIETFPALTPLDTDRESHRALAGISLPVRLTASGAIRAAASGGFLFTHFGFSGPAVLDLSHLLVRDSSVVLEVAWRGDGEETWRARLGQGPGGSSLSSWLERYLPDRLAAVLIAESGVAPDTRLSRLPREGRERLFRALSGYALPVSGHEGYSRAEVTGGGVSLEDVDRVTLESRIVSGLFLCGEMLDAFGPIGGHNFLWAWVTGRAAGIATAL